MNIREQRQEEFVKAYLESERRGILLLSLRLGKTRIGIEIIRGIGIENPRVLISYPENTIKNSWTTEMELVGYSNPNIIFSSNMSLEKWENEKFDLIIADEAHRLSDRNIESYQKLLETAGASLGLTGTLEASTKSTLRRRLKWPLVASYSTEEAIKDGIIADYRVNIVTVPLDNKRFIQYKKKRRTEKQQFNAYSFIIDKLNKQGKDTMHLSLARMRILQNSIARMESTRKLIKKFEGERILVFCGLVKIAEQLGIPVHHSKSEEDLLTPFMNGEGTSIAVIKIGGAGVTYKPLNKVIINYVDSNSENLQQKIGRAMNLEFEGQCCEVWIVSSNENVELNWLRKALKPFDPLKINWI
jgi:superfamily II DNA or RNA helicase